MGGVKTGRQRRRLTEVSAETNAMDPTALLRQPANHLPRAVDAAVVHVENFQLQFGTAGRFGNFLLKDGQAFLLVADRDYDGDHGFEYSGGSRDCRPAPD